MIEARDNAHAEAVRRARADALQEAADEIKRTAAHWRAEPSMEPEAQMLDYAEAVIRSIERLSTQPTEPET